MSEIITRITTIWNNMTTIRKAILLGGIALLLVIVGVYVYLSSDTKMAPLYPGVQMETGEAAMVVEQLEAMGYRENKTYRISDDGTQVYVPAEEAQRIKMSMASSGVVPAGGVGYEIFDNTGFGMTEADRKIAEQRAIKGELERIIKTLDQVQGCSVMIAMAEDSLFTKEAREGSVAVTLKLRAGQTLSEAQIKGIATMISASVKGVSVENVKIIDTAGNELSEFLADVNGSFGGSLTGVAEKNYIQKKLFEADLERKTKTMLEDVLGSNKATVRISADLNFDAEERTVIRYDNPELRSLRREFESRAGAVVPVGPGPVDNNTQYFIENVQGVTAQDIEYYNIDQNNELDTDTTHTIKAPGGINRLTAAVVLDGDFNEQEMQTFTEMVQAATGYLGDRGDIVSVVAAAFNTTEQEERKAEMDKAEKRAQLIQTITMVAQYLGVAGAIGLLLLTFFSLRRRLNRTQAILDEEDAAEMEVYLANQQAMQPITVDEIIEDASPRLKPQKEDITEKEIKQFANDSPDKVADIIKTWVLKDEG